MEPWRSTLGQVGVAVPVERSRSIRYKRQERVRIAGMITFDTLVAARELEDAGMEPAQAAAITHTIRSALSEGVATAADLAALRTDLAELKAELRADLAALTWRILGGVGLLLVVFTALDRLLA